MSVRKKKQQRKIDKIINASAMGWVTTERRRNLFDLNSNYRVECKERTLNARVWQLNELTNECVHCAQPITRNAKTKWMTTKKKKEKTVVKYWHRHGTERIKWNIEKLHVILIDWLTIYVFFLLLLLLQCVVQLPSASVIKIANFKIWTARSRKKVFAWQEPGKREGMGRMRTRASLLVQWYFMSQSHSVQFNSIDGHWALSFGHIIYYYLNFFFFHFDFDCVTASVWPMGTTDWNNCPQKKYGINRLTDTKRGQSTIREYESPSLNSMHLSLER